MQQLNSSNSSLTASVSTVNLISSSVLAVCFILGVPGNIAVMVRLSGWLKRSSFTPRLMLSLAISDLLTLISLPVWIWAVLHEWVFDLVLCNLLSYMIYLSFYCSALCVILMSMQRYIQVLHPEKWKKLGRKGKKILLSGMWMLSAVLSCYGLILSNISLDRGGRLQCTLRYRNNAERVLTLTWEIIIFVASFTIISYFYFQLHRGVNNSAFFSSNSLTKLVTRIVVFFFILWIPNQISDVVIIFAALTGNDTLLRSVVSVENVTTVLVFINSCVNPFLYAFSARALPQGTA
ncbi:leukotriene B4 receptor 1-like [Tachysurus fulvidraco]|uniref:leukotriene B4 receptor 1-like n=1 Tax=Tachysurus fulvidraco TaxID=1234273 RepID=UPI001FEF1F64|nr:leukotriene B4 receptor 1-like [Tachysurus fulvidraco]XP_047674753.1 leukotriene B4 receptor 1-like [Tachysurus fulvidraco]